MADELNYDEFFGGDDDDDGMDMMHEGEGNVKDEEDAIASMVFCSDCGNMLYPKENRGRRVLELACKHCGHVENAKNSCVYTHELTVEHGVAAAISNDVILDPTLPRTREIDCSKCGGNEAVYFSPANDMRLLFVCCNPDCCHRWKIADAAA